MGTIYSDLRCPDIFLARTLLQFRQPQLGAFQRCLGIGHSQLRRWIKRRREIGLFRRQIGFLALDVRMRPVERCLRRDDGRFGTLDRTPCRPDTQQLLQS